MSNITHQKGKTYRGSDKYWDIVWSFRITQLIEKTYIKSVSNGWLLRQFLYTGRNFSSSAIIFIPDPNFKWDADNDLDIFWEHIQTNGNANFKIHLHRLKTPKGWAVKEFLTTKRLSHSDKGQYSISLAYIPDSEHKWPTD